MLSYVTGEICRSYVVQRSTDAAVRRELEDLRAAINHHRREGLCNKIVEVVLPKERPAREQWLTRSEAARLIRSAWRYREMPISSLSLSSPARGQARYAVLRLSLHLAVFSAVWFIGAPRVSARPRNDSRRSPYPTAF